jgi:FkbM family methyltransferase
VSSPQSKQIEQSIADGRGYNPPNGVHRGLPARNSLTFSIAKTYCTLSSKAYAGGHMTIPHEVSRDISKVFSYLSSHLWQSKSKGNECLRSFCLDLSRILPNPVFVKIGANDGVTGDPCSDILLANLNWRGLLIEPVPDCFDRLKANFKDAGRFSWEQVAVGSAEGEITFFYVDPKANQSLPSLPVWFDQLGSFDRNHIVKHLDGVLEPFILERKVPVWPLSALLKKSNIQEVHLLHIDTEGYDYEVLKTLDFSLHAPLSIFIEHKHVANTQKTEMRRLLRKEGYSLQDCGGDYFAVKSADYRRLQRHYQHSGGNLEN